MPKYLLFATRSIFILLFLAVASLATGQPLQQNWFFGDANRTGIQFAKPTYTARQITRPLVTPYGMGGGAVANDRITGNLLFYTDGVRVFDRNHAAMTGVLAGDNTRNQAAAICQVPGTTDKYYVFTNSVTGTIQYSIVDMATGVGFPAPNIGTLISVNNPTGIPAGQSEAMIVVSNGDGINYWLINHDNAGNYYTTLITATPPFTTNVTAIGFINKTANLAYRQASSQIAASPKEPSRNIEILNFDNNTGALTMSMVVPNSSYATPAAGQFIYDTEWSPSGKYLYASVFGNAPITSDVLQFDLVAAATNPSTLPNSVFPITINMTGSYGLQMGPDSLIYHLYQTAGTTVVSRLADTDSVAAKVIYQSKPFPNKVVDYNAMQFPSFAPKNVIQMSLKFAVRDSCQGNVTTFFPSVTPAADSIHWNFGNGSSVWGWTASNMFAQSGPTTVTMVAYLNGDSTVYSRDVTINAFQVQINLTSDTTACPIELPYPRTPGVTGCKTSGLTCFTLTAQVQGASSMQWYGPAGAMGTSTKLAPDSAGYYYLQATDGSGCYKTSAVTIKEYGYNQDTRNVWHFGDHGGIDFNPLGYPPPKSNTPFAFKGYLNASPEGCADYCDGNGQTVVATDGQSIYDQKGNDVTPLPNPPGLGGSVNATQSSLIVPFPGGTPTKYYIFTTQHVDDGTYDLRYSVYDVAVTDATHPYGTVVIYNQLLFSRSTERITSNGAWLLAHEYGNNVFRAYQLGAGLGDPVLSNAGSIHSFSYTENAKGYMKFGINQMLFVPICTPGVSNVVEIFDFDNNTGIVSPYSTTPVADTKISTGRIYGIEFTAKKMMITITGTPSQLVEFYYNYKKEFLLITPPTISPETLGAIQIAPDQQYYVASNGQTYLKVINLNPDSTKTSTFQAQNFSLAYPGGTGVSSLGLPNDIQQNANSNNGPSMNITGFCFNDSTFFAGTGTDVIDKLTYTFDDGSSEVRMYNDSKPVFRILSTPGAHWVTLQIENRCAGIYFNQRFDYVINPKPPDPTKSVLFCANSVVLDANPSNTPNLTYLWTTNDTTKTITVYRTGSFGVTLTNEFGCTEQGTLSSIPALPQPIDLGNDSTFCQPTTIVLSTGINLPNHTWVLKGSPNVTLPGNGMNQSVTLSTPGTYYYKVTYTDTAPTPACMTSDSIRFVLYQAPGGTVTGLNPSSCTANGSLSVSVNNPPSVAADVYSYDITQTGDFGIVTTLNTPQLIASNFAAGTYTVNINDETNSCTTPVVKTLIAAGPFALSIKRSGNCDPIRVEIDRTDGGAPFNYTYNITDVNTGTVVESGSGNNFQVGTPIISTNPVPSSIYIVDITQNGTPCVSSSPNTAITPDPLVPVTFDPSQICSGQLSVTSATATSYDWTASDAGSLVNPNTTGATVTLIANATAWDIVVTASGGAGTCPTTINQPFSYNNASVTLTGPTTCSSPVILTANGTGPNNIYTWTVTPPGGPASSTPGTNTLTATVLADYQVSIQSYNGCLPQTASLAAFDPGQYTPITLTVASNAACKGTPFDVTATTDRTVSTYAWTFNNAAVGTNTNPLAQQTKAGIYGVTVTQGVCQTTTTLNVATLADATDGDLPPTGLICPPGGQTITLDPDPKSVHNFISFDWYLDGQSASTTSQTFTAIKGGTYEVHLVNVQNCASVDQIILVEECEPDLNAPTAFKPSSNVTENQEFYVFPVYVDTEGFQVFIFNRWGEMVYQSNDLAFRWNGNFNNGGASLPPGTYSWVAKFRSKYNPDSGVKTKHGGVVLLR